MLLGLSILLVDLLLDLEGLFFQRLEEVLQLLHVLAAGLLHQQLQLFFLEIGGLLEVVGVVAVFGHPWRGDFASASDIFLVRGFSSVGRARAHRTRLWREVHPAVLDCFHLVADLVLDLVQVVFEALALVFGLLSLLLQFALELLLLLLVRVGFVDHARNLFFASAKLIFQFALDFVEYSSLPALSVDLPPQRFVLADHVVLPLVAFVQVVVQSLHLFLQLSGRSLHALQSYVFALGFYLVRYIFLC